MSDIEMIERLLRDPELRRAFRADATRPSSELSARESRSSLAGALVAGAMDSVAAVHPHDAHDVLGPAMRTGRLTALVSHSHGSSTDLPYPGNDASRERIAAWMGDQAERYGLPRELPVMAALVESDLHNLDHGDRASLGYFQMQTTYWLDRYPGKPELQLKWFIDQALAVRAKRPELVHDPTRWGEWVADVEQPAEQLRGRYATRLDDARALLHGAGPPDAPGTSGGPAIVKAKPAHVTELPAMAARTGLHAAPTDPVDAIKAQAARIDRAHIPYELGGGHAGRELYSSPVTPLDCSGAVSRLLGIDPRVAKQFETWGKPGRGRRVTIYAKDDHVLMEIDGHFWGTSRSNPGGGAGWIPRRSIPDGYLAQFTARHPAGE